MFYRRNHMRHNDRSTALAFARQFGSPATPSSCFLTSHETHMLPRQPRHRRSSWRCSRQAERLAPGMLPLTAGPVGIGANRQLLVRRHCPNVPLTGLQSTCRLASACLPADMYVRSWPQALTLVARALRFVGGVTVSSCRARGSGDGAQGRGQGGSEARREAGSAQGERGARRAGAKGAAHMECVAERLHCPS